MTRCAPPLLRCRSGAGPGEAPGPHLSRHLRTELGPKNVRVAAIEPGIVGTELQSHVTDEDAREWLAGTKATMEWLTPRDVADTVAFLATLPPRANLQQVTIMPTGQPA